MYKLQEQLSALVYFRALCPGWLCVCPQMVTTFLNDLTVVPHEHPRFHTLDAPFSSLFSRSCNLQRREVPVTKYQGRQVALGGLDGMTGIKRKRRTLMGQGNSIKRDSYERIDVFRWISCSYSWKFHSALRFLFYSSLIFANELRTLSSSVFRQWRKSDRNYISMWTMLLKRLPSAPPEQFSSEALM